MSPLTHSVKITPSLNHLFISQMLSFFGSRQISNVFSIHLNEEDEGGLCDFEQLPRLLARSERMSG